MSQCMKCTLTLDTTQSNILFLILLIYSSQKRQEFGKDKNNVTYPNKSISHGYIIKGNVEVVTDQVVYI